MTSSQNDRYNLKKKVSCYEDFDDEDSDNNDQNGDALDYSIDENENLNRENSDTKQQNKRKSIRYQWMKKTLFIS